MLFFLHTFIHWFHIYDVKNVPQLGLQKKVRENICINTLFSLSFFFLFSRLFLQSPANPDLLYIIFFCHTQLTVTLLLLLIFGSKVSLYNLLVSHSIKNKPKQHKKHGESMISLNPVFLKFIQVCLSMMMSIIGRLMETFLFCSAAFFVCVLFSGSIVDVLI